VTHEPCPPLTLSDPTEHIEHRDFASLWTGPMVHGFASSLRIGGSLTLPTSTIVGLRGWNDAHEEVVTLDNTPTPCVFFDIEKWLRMLLRQSHLAVEIFLSPHSIWKSPRSIPATKIVSKAITRGIGQTYLDLVRGPLSSFVRGESLPDLEIRGLFRELLTGWHLYSKGIFSLHLNPLVELTEDDALRTLTEGELDIQVLRRSADKYVKYLGATAKSALPSNPSDYEFMQDWLVARRLNPQDEM
jgi:hypothetical protein